MRRYAPAIAPAVAVGVGAAFDFHAGTKRRAPDWMQRSGLEWAHRLASEPRRLAGRYVRTNTEFVIRAVLEIASARRLG
jgi:N-acetylglucosaminyldiphosphoundecaprenol N-acetyl-beta-D-mannosaminyltransferase